MFLLNWTCFLRNCGGFLRDCGAFLATFAWFFNIIPSGGVDEPVLTKRLAFLLKNRKIYQNMVILICSGDFWAVF